MIPAGYMYKLVSTSDGKQADSPLVGIYSVGACGANISPFFTDYIPHWKHNGYWFFHSPSVMHEIAAENHIDLSRMTLFFYELYEFEFDLPDTEDEAWIPIESESSFVTQIVVPPKMVLAGFDVVEYVCRNAPECSLLSCCNLAKEFTVNSHCLFDSFEEAKVAVESGKFHEREPGPYRILAVHVVTV